MAEAVKSVIAVVGVLLTSYLTASTQVKSQFLPDSDMEAGYPFSATIEEVFAPRETPLHAHEYEVGYLRCASLFMLFGGQALHDGAPVDERILDEKINTLGITAAIYGGIAFDDSMTAEQVMTLTSEHFERNGRSLMLQYADWINAYDIRLADIDQDKEHPLSKDRYSCEKIALGLIQKFEAEGK